MKTVPTLDGSGTIPLCASKNPVLGVYKHHCGQIATVHQPKGRKAHLRYLICPQCKTDQASGKEYQAKIRSDMQPSLEALAEVEASTPNLIGSDTTDLTEKQPIVTSSEQPLGTNETAVPNQKSTEPLVPGTETTELTDELTDEPVKAVNPPTNNTDRNKPKRVGIFAVVGGIIGGLLAIAI